MNIQLIKGSFNTAEAIELVTQLINVKIQFHENKISKTHSEEDIKMREGRIKQLYKELYDARKHILSQNKNIAMESQIALTE